MTVKINPELWNTLTSVQKRAMAESVHVEPRRFRLEAGELAAWATTLAAAFGVISLAALILH
jgi:hypothetical protein